MDSRSPLKTLDPEPIDSPVSSRPFGITTSSGPLPMRPAMDQQPDRANDMDLPRATPVSRAAEFKASDFPPKASDYPKTNDYPKDNSYPKPHEFPRGPDIKSNCQRNLKHLIYLQNQRRAFGYSSQAVDLEWQIRSQTGLLIGELRTLQDEVRTLVKNAKNHRWRRWLFGGFLATFVPVVRKLFRRGNDKESLASSNNTEYAFRKSKGLLQRIKDSVLGHHRLASIAFFVFSVMYVFQNEVTLRVAKTMQKRLKKLSQRLEYGNQEIDEKDLKLLDGWRWRVILW
ncbi:hypothetical protein TrVFT333_008158 [Trichoderma virens FT-333]|nr:hypothetical protein TrVFT333_008158 [Trichoderma virens FT-333]